MRRWNGPGCESKRPSAHLRSPATLSTSPRPTTTPPRWALGLKKQFLAAERLIDPALLAAIKRQTNEWEAEYAALDRHPEPRPLNLDPGYITAAKLVLASTKDHAHRIYLQDGIYAEVTLAYRHRAWQPLEWTYPDYRRADFQEFFTRCREFLLQHSGSK